MRRYVERQPNVTIRSDTFVKALTDRPRLHSPVTGVSSSRTRRGPE
jgi:hypothetical protein